MPAALSTMALSIRSAASCAQFDQQEQLRECVVFAGHALGEPPLGDREHLRKQPALDLGVEAMDQRSISLLLVVLTEVFLERQLGQQKRNLVVAMPFQVVQRVDACLSHDRSAARSARRSDSRAGAGT